MNNGYEFYREIRKIDTKVKVCFLTASEIYNETLRVPPPGLLDGVNCFIPKPVDIDELVKKVKNWIYYYLLLSTTIIYYYLLVEHEFE